MLIITLSVPFYLKKKGQIRKYIFALYFPIIPFFWNILYSNFNHQKIPIFLRSLYLSKKLKPPKIRKK
jgi:hypothetical protein